MAINSFFASAEKISDVSNETVPAIRGILDHLRGQPDAQYLSKAQIVAVLFDIVNIFFSRTFALVANSPTIAPRPIFRNMLLAALVVPNELNTALHHVRLANKDRNEAWLEERQPGHESRMLAMEKRMNANVNAARAPRPTVPVVTVVPTGPITPPEARFPCHRWLRGEFCNKECGYYHDEWPTTVTAAQKDSFMATALRRDAAPSAAARKGPE
jgi:hypothetical protein